MTQRDYITLYDTTLRDGAQTTGVDFSLEDKIHIAHLLDQLGVDYIEGGYPGANPLDTTFLSKNRGLKAKLTAFSMTKRTGRSLENDPGLLALLDASVQAITFVGKTWDYHVHIALGVSLEENIESIAQSIQFACAHGREALLDCEHFFDGYKANPDYALACVLAAYESGARWIVLCDTNGGSLPHEIETIVAKVAQKVPGSHIGIHTHNDTEQAVANSLAAIRAGARHIQGTLNGLGERCGNANLTSLIPTLLLKSDYRDSFEIGPQPENLLHLTRISHTLDELLNRAPHRHAPYVGASAFATKAGIHASALLKDTRTYEHVPPESVGNRRRILVSDQAGKSNILMELERLGLQIEKGDKRLDHLLREVKEKEALGYAYEGADASFELLARRLLGGVPSYFDVERFSVHTEQVRQKATHVVSLSQAIVKLKIGGKHLLSVAEGNGPVHALDQALRKDLGKYQSYIKDLELLDYRVRIFKGGTDAVTRVLISFGDSHGEEWSTVGVSTNVIDASFEALSDAIVYRLLKLGAE